MRTKQNAVKNSTIGIITTAPWRVAKVTSVDHFCLQVRFLDGVTGKINLSNLIFSKNAGVFAVLKNPELFNQVYLELGVVTWPGEIDLAPDTMYEMIKKQGEWEP